MKLVNKRSGRVLAEGNWASVHDAIENTMVDMNDELWLFAFDKNRYGEPVWHDYSDLAIETEISYREYKTKYADLRTKKDSYNPTTKTVIVYMQDDEQRHI